MTDNVRDLSLDLGLRASYAGAPAEMPLIHRGRDLTPEDIARLSERGRTLPETGLKKLSDSHHAVARALASGMSTNAVAAVTGYTPTRISMLKADPMFAELIEFYRKDLNEVYASLHDRMAILSLDVAQELQERLQDDPGALSTGMLHDLLKLLADRTGHAPVTRSVNQHNVTVGFADALAAARKREDDAMKLIEQPRDSLTIDKPPTGEET
jgi:hypothetical protein